MSKSPDLHIHHIMLFVKNVANVAKKTFPIYIE